EKRRHLGRHLPGLRVERPTAAEDKVRAFLLQRQRQRPGGADRVREREGPVGELNAAVGAEAEALSQGVFCLRRAHRHRNHLTPDGVAQPHCFGDGARVEGIQDQRHALSLERLRLLIELDLVGPRDLFDEADDLHRRETNRGAWDPLRHPRESDRARRGSCRGRRSRPLVARRRLRRREPWPHETLERLRGLPNATWIRGNGERWLFEPPEDRPEVREGYNHFKDELSPEEQQWLFDLPPQAEIEGVLYRSEERRVGKECRSRWA